MIIFTEHSKAKMKQRNISQKLVEKVLKSPDNILPSYGKRKIAYKKIGRLFLRVVFKKEEGRIIVITTHWIKKWRSK